MKLPAIGKVASPARTFQLQSATILGHRVEPFVAVTAMARAPRSIRLPVGLLVPRIGADLVTISSLYEKPFGCIRMANEREARIAAQEVRK
jgi:hypothetical protein